MVNVQTSNKTRRIISLHGLQLLRASDKDMFQKITYTLIATQRPEELESPETQVKNL